MSTKIFSRTILFAVLTFLGVNGCVGDRDDDVDFGTTESEVALPPPTNLTVNVVRSDRQDLAWTAVAGTSKHIVYRGVNGAPVTPYTECCLGTTNTFIATNLQPSTNYCWAVANVNNLGERSTLSNTVCTTSTNNGIEGYWKFNENGGTLANDSSGLGRNATLSGGASFTGVNKAPLLDNKSSFSITSAATARAQATGVSAFRLTTNFTVSFWARTAAAGQVRFMGMRAAACGALGWEIQQNAGVMSFDGQSGSVSFAAGIPTDQTWHHVAVTSGAGTMRTYIDGVATGLGAYTPTNTTPASTPLHIGHPNGCAGGAAAMDDVQIQSRVLTPTEISNIGSRPAAPSNLVITRITSTVMDLAWDPVAGAERYQIYRNGTFYTNSPATPSTFNADHLQPNTEYGWAVRTVRGGVISVSSPEVFGTTTSGPEAPTGVVATPLTNTKIRVTWGAVADATKYYILQSTDGVNFTPKGSVIAPTVTFDAVNLTPNTLYYYVVAAEDAGLTRSPNSDPPAQATTLP